MKRRVRCLKCKGMINMASRRKPGRPRAIPQTLVPKVLSLYFGGLGYRAVARELREEGISADLNRLKEWIYHQHTRARHERKGA